MEDQPAGFAREAVKAAWLADAIARADSKKKAANADAEKGTKTAKAKTKSAVPFPVKGSPVAKNDLMPAAIHPMLASSVAKPFDNPD